MPDSSATLPDRCPVCTGDRRDSLWTWHHEPFLKDLGIDKRQEVVVCLDCGIVYRSPPLERALHDRMHETWSLESDDEEDLADRVTWLRERVPRWGPDLRVLEVGSATGKMLKRLRDAGVDARGVEPNPQSVRAARAQGLVVHEGYVEATSLPEGFYDVVMFMHLLEHLDDPRGFLLSVRRILREEGFAYLEVPNLMQVPRPLLPFLPSFHRTEFVPLTLTNLLISCGLEPVAVEAAWGLRVLAKAAEPRTVAPPGPRAAREIGQAFTANLVAKYLFEVLMDIDLSRPETLDKAAAVLRGSDALVRHLHWRLEVVERCLARWRGGLEKGPERNWPLVLRDAVETLRRDHQLVHLLIRMGHPGLATPGTLGRVTFRGLNVDDLSPTAVAANRREDVLKWLDDLFRSGTILSNLLDALQQHFLRGSAPTS